MKFWRWTGALVSMAAMVAACSVKSSKDDGNDSNDDGNGGGSTTSNNTSSSNTGTGTTSSTGGATVASSSGSGQTGCANEADFASCADCFYATNMSGGDAYVTALINNIYCGETCGAGDCADFCAAVETDPSTMVPMECSTCVQGIGQGDADATAFSEECSADANCVQFANDLQTCP